MNEEKLKVEELFDKAISFGSNVTVLPKEYIDMYYMKKQRVKKAIEKHFVCGFEQGLGGAIHSKNCRKCNLLKELDLKEE